MATINHKKYDEATETFKDFSVYDGKETLIFKVDGSTGNVGIGTISPQSVLHILAPKPTYTDSAVVFRGGTTNNNSHTGITLTSAGNALTGGIGSNYLVDGTSASQSNSNRSTGYLRFANTTNAGKTSTVDIGGFVKGTTTDVSRLFIDNDGQVGIGTSTPADRLEAAGNIRANVSNGGGFMLTGSSTSGLVRNGGTGVSLRTNATDRLTVDVSGYVRLESGTGGLQFNGDTAAANALDDYEEGTFTPTFEPASGAYGTLTYGTTNGKYTKIGNRVDFALRVTVTAYSAGTASGLLRLSGLPFSCATSYVGSISFSLVDNFAANRYPIKGFVNDQTSYILLRYMTALNTNEAYVNATDITATSSLRISGTYFTA